MHFVEIYMEFIYLMSDLEKLQIDFNKVHRERNSWKNKYQILNTTNSKMQSLLKEQKPVGNTERLLTVQAIASRRENSVLATASI